VTYLEGVYWDLDGTIANTELEAHLPAFNNAFNDLGIDWNWDTNTYIKLLKINGGKNRIAYYAKYNNDNFSEDLILKIHETKQFHYLETIKKSEFSCGVNYLSLDSMGELSKKIIESNNLKGKIDFFFGTLIVDMKFNDKEWLLTSKNGDKFKSKYLICSTNLLLHKRSLKILNINQIPLRKAIPLNYDKKIDLLLNFLGEQTFIPRFTFLIYTNKNYSYKDFYSKKQRYFYFRKNLENKYKFERIIFQLQDNKILGIVVHSKNTELINYYISEKDEEVFKQKIITNFNKLFEENSIVHKLTFDEKISIMKWRASQPSGIAVPLSLQFSKKFRIGFCGDWFEGDGFGRIEGSILSALILEKKIKDLIK